MSQKANYLQRREVPILKCYSFGDAIQRMGSRARPEHLRHEGLDNDRVGAQLLQRKIFGPLSILGLIRQKEVSLEELSDALLDLGGIDNISDAVKIFDGLKKDEYVFVAYPAKGTRSLEVYPSETNPQNYVLKRA